MTQLTALAEIRKTYSGMRLSLQKDTQADV